LHIQALFEHQFHSHSLQMHKDILNVYCYSSDSFDAEKLSWVYRYIEVLAHLQAPIQLISGNLQVAGVLQQFCQSQAQSSLFQLHALFDHPATCTEIWDIATLSCNLSNRSNWHGIIDTSSQRIILKEGWIRFAWSPSCIIIKGVFGLKMWWFF